MAKWVSDLEAFSITLECLRFSADGLTVWLKPNMTFVTKNLLVLLLPVELDASVLQTGGSIVTAQLECLASTCR